LTKEILKLGLWDSKQLVTKKMKRLKTKTEKQNALKSQINSNDNGEIRIVLERKLFDFSIDICFHSHF
jgi:ribosomal protein L7/L12